MKFFNKVYRFFLFWWLDKTGTEQTNFVFIIYLISMLSLPFLLSYFCVS